MHTHTSPRLFAILAALFLALFWLTGCTQVSNQPQERGPGNVEAPVATPSAATVPSIIQVQTQLQPAIDPVCLEPRRGFALVYPPIPKEGLEPGMVHLFCAVGAPEGQTVTFTLTDPQGEKTTYQGVSVDQGGVRLAVQPITIGPDAAVGTWTLTASYDEHSDQVSFQVRPASQPFIVLTEPVEDNPDIIKASVGGLPPNAKIYFAVYRLQSGQVQDGMATTQGELLIDDLIQVDEAGRADVQLDVSYQPEGPYLLTFFPPDEPASPLIRLPEQERTALPVNIHRPQTVAEQPSSPPGSSSGAQPAGPLPPAPEIAEGSGALPQAITVALPSAQLPTCSSTPQPSLRVWPATGEVGQWWYGCATGFTPNQPLQVQATLPNGETSTFNITPTDAQGTHTFRWYAPPSEGTGLLTLQVSDATGATASTQWRIAPATTPHLLVYPHTVEKEVGAELYLTGFPPRTQVQLGLYRLDEQGAGQQVTTWQVNVDKQGVLEQKPFEQVQKLEPGIYALLAQSAPTYHLSALNIPASAVEFFSVATPLPQAYEFYTLTLGRHTGQLVAVGEEAPASPEQPPAAATTPAPSTSGIPQTLTIPADHSNPPTCPNATAGQPAICLMPAVTQRATYVYMLMHGFPAGAKFNITVIPPKESPVKFTVTANDQGLAEAHWYALNNERLGTYRVRIRGAGKYNGAFKVVKATAPHIVVQPRSPQPGTPVIISISGLKPNTTYAVARYRSVGETDGQVQFQLMDVTDMTTGKGGGAQAPFPTQEKDAGTLFLAVLFEKGGSQPLAKEVYAPDQELYLRYPFAWGQNVQEGN